MCSNAINMKPMQMIPVHGQFSPNIENGLRSGMRILSRGEVRGGLGFEEPISYTLSEQDDLSAFFKDRKRMVNDVCDCLTHYCSFHLTITSLSVPWSAVFIAFYDHPGGLSLSLRANIQSDETHCTRYFEPCKRLNPFHGSY